VGCFVGRMFYGAVAHVDDVTVLVPTPQASRIILRTFENFATEFSVSFNVKKTK
jgi:hypothetical protein